MNAISVLPQAILSQPTLRLMRTPPRVCQLTLAMQLLLTEKKAAHPVELARPAVRKDPTL